MFTQNTFRFLDELAANNNKAWFEANKKNYELLVREPALDFIEEMAPVLASFAPAFRAEPRKLGGSLMRVYRDTRFSRNKTPYKTNIGIQFRHQLGKDIHAPGFYVHIASDECFFAVGCWHPEPDVLGGIRHLITEKPEQWIATRDDKKFTALWDITGDSLTRPPRGYDVNHPLIADIKRKDFIALSALSAAEVTGSGLVKLAGKRFSATVPFMKLLCAALDVPF
ncbi:MAG TPA: DUF2461 domain-containing protein [Gallionellaceae bacterium]|nr:DUF2461 domain-containing protein [Gallionellaceae bacterium]